VKNWLSFSLFAATFICPCLGQSGSVPQLDTSKAVEGLNSLADVLPLTLGVVSKQHFGPFPITGECSVGCFMCFNDGHQVWHTSVDLTPDQGGLLYSVTSEESDNHQFCSIVAPAWRIPADLSASDSGMQSAFTVLLANDRGATASSPSDANAYAVLHAVLSANGANFDEMAKMFARYVSILASARTDLLGAQNLHKADKDKIGQSVAKLEPQLHCGSDQVEDVKNSIDKNMSTAYDAIEAAYANQDRAADSAQQGGAFLAGTLQTMKVQLNSIGGQLMAAQQLPPGPVRTVHLQIARNGWQDLIVYAQQQLTPNVPLRCATIERPDLAGNENRWTLGFADNPSIKNLPANSKWSHW